MRVSCRHWSVKIGAVFFIQERRTKMGKRDKEIPYDESREDEDCEEWEEVDSCWGCYEETDELIKEVMIENGLEE